MENSGEAFDVGVTWMTGERRSDVRACVARILGTWTAGVTIVKTAAQLRADIGTGGRDLITLGGGVRNCYGRRTLQHDPSDIPTFLQKIDGGLRHRQRLEEGAHRQPVDAADPVEGCELDDVETEVASRSMIFGTTFKAYRREDPKAKFPCTGELHRFIPALAIVVWRVDLRNPDQEHQS